MVDIKNVVSRIRVFKWKAKIPAEEGLPESESRGIVLLLRLHTAFTTPTSQPDNNDSNLRWGMAGVASFPKNQLSNLNIHTFKFFLLRNTLKTLPILDSCTNLELLASNLASEIASKFRFSPEILSGQGPKPVIFLDLHLTIDKFGASASALANMGDDYDVCKDYELDKFIDDEGDISVEQIEDLLNIEYGININVGHDEPTAKGLDEVKAGLKLKPFVEDHDDDGCPICWESFSKGMEVAETPCSHKFHKGCIFRWLSTRDSCPMCASTCSVVV